MQFLSYTTLYFNQRLSSSKKGQKHNKKYHPYDLCATFNCSEETQQFYVMNRLKSRYSVISLKRSTSQLCGQDFQ